MTDVSNLGRAASAMPESICVHLLLEDFQQLTKAGISSNFNSRNDRAAGPRQGNLNAPEGLVPHRLSQHCWFACACAFYNLPCAGSRSHAIAANRRCIANSFKSIRCRSAHKKLASAASAITMF